MLEWLFGDAEAIPEWYTRDQAMRQVQQVPSPRFDPDHAELARRALALFPNADPRFNLWPVMELLREADRLGLEVKRREASG